MILGNPGDDHLCTEFALQADCIVVSLIIGSLRNILILRDSRTAIALSNGYLMSGSRGIDSTRIAVGGASAGGGAGCSAHPLTRDRNGPELCFSSLCIQCWIIGIAPSSYEITHTSFGMESGAQCGGLADVSWTDVKRRCSGICLSSLATDLTGLPSAYICVGELDLFRDEILIMLLVYPEQEFRLNSICIRGVITLPEHVVPGSGKQSADSNRVY